ncbi:MAG TPA: hypothetical protein VG734_02285 [Lacunisphaera sp.]|nr:hypothetical protein [Lacunisphaera sp.]
MIIPEYWAEARVQRPRKKGDSQVTVRRFGWSLTSQAEAEQMASERADAALKRILGGSPLLRRSEPKVPYNGAEGVPIREEVLTRDGETVITRNSYGAHCLNTPNVLFADIDYEITPRIRSVAFTAFMLMILGAIAAAWFKSFTIVLVAAFVVLVVSYPLTVLNKQAYVRARGGAVKYARTRLDAFFAKHRDWHARLYRTPNGLRVLVLHRTFKPDEPAVKDFFNALGVDPLYAKMCFNQQCFRARVSPKPWRMGFAAHLRPRPGVWPVKPEQMNVRNGWIQEYEAKARAFASCKYLESLGPKRVDPKAAKVLALHDDLSQALSAKPIA